MAPVLGKLFLYLALITSLCSAVLPFYNKNLKNYRVAWAGIFGFAFLSMLCLIYSYVISDFTVINVYNNSHTDKPLIYKISGAWGNHEGSMLLWLSGIAFFGFLFSQQNNKQLVPTTLAIQAIVFALFCAYTIFFSNPFARIFPAPINGLGLNPILQDIGLAMHPPMLYLGYVGFSITFSAAIAGIIKLKVDKDWVNLIRPFILLSWTFLTLGVGLGSWWAYRELGWGGFWFWDPVENASLMPWLCATALIHSSVILARTGSLKTQTLILALITFALSMVGTFLVRSGLITSVHSFATDPTRGVVILIVMVALVGSALLLFACRVHKLEPKVIPVKGVHRLMVFNNIFFIVGAAVILIGTLYPLIMELAKGYKISVGANYYNSMFAPLTLLSLLLCSFASNVIKPNLGWKLLAFYFVPIIILAIQFTILLAVYFKAYDPYSLFGIMLSLMLAIVIVVNYARAPNVILAQFRPMFLAHLGFAILIAAISINALLKDEAEELVKIGDKFKFKDFNLEITTLLPRRGENYHAVAADVEVQFPSNKVIYLKPEIRFFIDQGQQTSESAIYHHPLYDLYIAMGEIDLQNGISLRIYYRPMMGWIWFGCMLMFFGGITAMVKQIFKSNVKSTPTS